MTQPTLGRIVHYTLTLDDAQAIINDRHNYSGRAGNPAAAGDVFAATIVRVWTLGDDAPCNLQVHLDGNDALWVTSRVQGEQPGTWAWPPRA